MIKKFESFKSIKSGKYFDELKGKFKDFIDCMKQEGTETKEAYKLLVKSMGSDSKLTKEEKTKLGEQMKDVLKLVGFTAASILPGGIIYLLISRISVLKKHMIPSAFIEKENENKNKKNNK